MFFTDIDECANANAGCSQLCENNAGKYECKCKEGYVLSKEDGQTCDGNLLRTSNLEMSKVVNTLIFLLI